MEGCPKGKICLTAVGVIFLVIFFAFFSYFANNLRTFYSTLNLIQ